jgi:hypothetical protein
MRLPRNKTKRTRAANLEMLPETVDQCIDNSSATQTLDKSARNLVCRSHTHAEERERAVPTLLRLRLCGRMSPGSFAGELHAAQMRVEDVPMEMPVWLDSRLVSVGSPAHVAIACMITAAFLPRCGRTLS